MSEMYAFVGKDARGRAFDLYAKYPAHSLLSLRKESISSCGLHGENINVIWTENGDRY